MTGFTDANAAYVEVATDLGARAVCDALDSAGLAPADVDALVAVSSTGVAVPTIDARLASRVGLRPDVKRIPLFGLGCVAGAAGMARVHDYLRGYPGHVAVLLSVELCSLTLQRDDASTPRSSGFVCSVTVLPQWSPPARTGRRPTQPHIRGRRCLLPRAGCCRHHRRDGLERQLQRLRTRHVP